MAKDLWVGAKSDPVEQRMEDSVLYSDKEIRPIIVVPADDRLAIPRLRPEPLPIQLKLEDKKIIPYRLISKKVIKLISN